MTGRPARDKEFAKEFLAGGGDESELRTIESFFESQTEVSREQFEHGTYAMCGADFFYVFKAHE